jgi:hypothetical protein
MIDQADRPTPRFPASAANRARGAICQAIENIVWARPGSTIALAGAASGGDLLFHECCEELGIPARVLLALPPDEFLAASVSPSGPEWERRFHSLLARAGSNLCLMPPGETWPEGAAADDLWQRANLWMIDQATGLAPERALLALWDGKAGDGPGGTEYFLRAAEESGIRVLPIISTPSLLHD